MERLQRLSGGCLLPSDLDKVRKVFDDITRQAWFDTNDYSKEGFASKLIVVFQCGIVRLDQLTTIGAFLALNEFSRKMPHIQREKLKAACKQSLSVGREPLVRRF